MITGPYTFDGLKSELKPTNKQSPIYSIRVARVGLGVFVNYKGKPEVSVARPTKTLETDDSTVYIFQVDGVRYWFEILDQPAKRRLVTVYSVAPVRTTYHSADRLKNEDS